MANGRPMTKKELEEYKREIEDKSPKPFSIENNYKKGTLECFSLVKEKEDSALYVVVKLTFKDGKLTKTEQVTDPEYKAFAFLKFKFLLQKNLLG